MSESTPDLTPEVCINLWAYADPETKMVQRVAARMYVLLGDDNAKLQTLSTLAFTDNAIAKWSAVPDHQIVVLPDGTRIPGLVRIDVLHDNATRDQVFAPLLRSLEDELPGQMGFRPDGGLTSLCMPIPDEPLFLLTPAWEYPDGQVIMEVPRLGDTQPTAPGVQ